MITGGESWKEQPVQYGEEDSRAEAEVSPPRVASSRTSLLTILPAAYSNIESPLNRWAAPYSDGACSFITSRAIAECAIAAPARISAATQMASMISCSVAHF